MNPSSPTFAHIVVILHRPQLLPNIGGVVRAMRNMGLRHLRLVAPVAYTPSDITGIAHRCDDIVATIQHYHTLHDALADMHYIVGTTARPRTAHHHTTHDIRTLAQQVLAHATHGNVALLFGSEDNGLDNDALAWCHQVVHIPTDESYASLNLSHAVLLVAYELRMAAHHTAHHNEATPTTSSPHTPRAAHHQLYQLAHTWEQTLHSIAFFKAQTASHLMRQLRIIIIRSNPTEREVALLFAIAHEIRHVIERITHNHHRL